MVTREDVEKAEAAWEAAAEAVYEADAAAYEAKKARLKAAYVEYKKLRREFENGN